jgi:hypothetical protein
VQSVLPPALKVIVPEAPAVTVAVSVSVWPRLKFVEVAVFVTLCVALLTVTVNGPAAVKFSHFVESSGAKSAVNEVEALTALGVQLQVAVVEPETKVQPVMAVPPDLNVTLPALLTVAVIVTAVPYVAVVALAGSASEIVGVPLLTVIAVDVEDAAK